MTDQPVDLDRNEPDDQVDAEATDPAPSPRGEDGELVTPDAPAEYDPNQRLVDPSKGTDEPPNTGEPAADQVDEQVDSPPVEGPPAEAGELDMRDQQDDRDEQDALDAAAKSGREV